jgi:nicotinate-nucleotide adenylyltransferase
MGERSFPRRSSGLKEPAVRKLGIFGGTFNPPQMANLMAAEGVRDQLKLDKVLFVPAAIPPHKQKENIVPVKHRLEMVRLAIRGNRYFEISDVELHRKGPSYTIDTVREMRRSYPDDELLFIMGIDLLTEFDTWKEPDMILEECRLVAMNRPGFDLAVIDKDLLMRVELVNVPSVDISSTNIRRRVKSGRSIRYLVTQDVEEYIHGNSIYL